MTGFPTDVTADLLGIALWIEGSKVAVFDSVADARRAQQRVPDLAHEALGMLAASLAKTNPHSECGQ